MIAVPHDLPGTPEHDARMRYAWRVVSVTGIGIALIGLSVSTLNVALPVMVRHFGAGPVASSWVLLSYLLVSTSTLVFFGRLADLVGRREIYLLGFALFTVASLLAGFAPAVEPLIALRALQGIGAGMILANGTVLIADAFPPGRLGRGMGVYLATFSIAQFVGPTLGGVIADVAGWRWIFWLNVPFGLAGIVWGAVTLRRTPRGPRASLDLAGNVLIFVVIAAALVALSEMGSGDFSPGVLLAGALALALLPVLVAVERRAANPALDLRLFGERLLAMANTASFWNALARASLIVVSALYFQAALGMDTLTAGLAVLPAPIGMTLASPLAGFLERRLTPYAASVAGAAIGCAGLLLLTLTADPATPYAVIAAGLFLAGAGNGMFLTGNTTYVMNLLPPGSRGVVNGFRLMIMNVGIVLSVGTSLGVLTGPVSAELRAQVYQGTLSRLSPVAVDQLMTGFTRAYAFLCAVTLLSIAFAAAARRRA
ncbi:MAG: MFS transporter [Actinomycetes bacterium]|nr:MAG: MFS transporter [Actinomycetota bacterium]